MRASAPPNRRPDLIFRRIDDDVFVYDPIRDRVLLLNATSAFILDLCDGTRSWEEIEAEVAAAFPVARELVASDVAAMRQQFRHAGLFRSGTGG
jgi:hypothetical protein